MWWCTEANCVAVQILKDLTVCWDLMESGPLGRGYDNRYPKSSTHLSMSLLMKTHGEASTTESVSLTRFTPIISNLSVSNVISSPNILHLVYKTTAITKKQYFTAAVKIRGKEHVHTSVITLCSLTGSSSRVRPELSGNKKSFYLFNEHVSHVWTRLEHGLSSELLR